MSECDQKLIDEILSSALPDERKLDLVYFYVSGMNSEEFTRAVINGACRTGNVSKYQ